LHPDERGKNLPSAGGAAGLRYPVKVGLGLNRSFRVFLNPLATNPA
jgi:hypothetical protein